MKRTMCLVLLCYWCCLAFAAEPKVPEGMTRQKLTYFDSKTHIKKTADVFIVPKGYSFAAHCPRKKKLKNKPSLVKVQGPDNYCNYGACNIYSSWQEVVYTLTGV